MGSAFEKLTYLHKPLDLHVRKPSSKDIWADYGNKINTEPQISPESRWFGGWFYYRVEPKVRRLV